MYAFCQNKSAVVTLDSGEKIDTVAILNLDEYKNYYSKVNLSSWTNLQDSGSYDDNGFKNGHWIEYPIDTTLMDSESNIRNDSLKSEVYKPELIKITGNYINGEKDGNWKTYVPFGPEKNAWWKLQVSSEFKNGKKNGSELTYTLWANDTLTYTIYEMDIPIEYKTYDPPNYLKTVIKIEKDKCVQYNFDENGEIINKRIIE